MKQAAYLVLACGLALTVLGCAKQTTSNSTAAGDYTLVNLKVPNMT